MRLKHREHSWLLTQFPGGGTVLLMTLFGLMVLSGTVLALGDHAAVAQAAARSASAPRFHPDSRPIAPSSRLLSPSLFSPLNLASAPDTSSDLLVLSNTGSPSPAVLGIDTVTYNLGVFNSSGGTTTNVLITDTLPVSSTFVSATPNFGSCHQASGVVTCTVSSLAASQNAFVSIVVSPTTTGVLTDTAVTSC